MSDKRIGILGGTFDPVHIGHLIAAVEARYQCGLDRVLLEVAPNPWQKVGSRDISPAELRYQAVAAAVANVPGIEPSRREIDRGGLTYSADTLDLLRSEFPNTEIFLILGADAAAGLPSWHEADRVASLAQVIVLNRPGVGRPSLDERWRILDVDMPPIDVSSSDLRSRLAEGRPVDFLIPRPALELIVANGQYAGTDTARADRSPWV